MSTQVRDPFLAVTIDGTGATHYRVAHENLSGATYTRLPEPSEDGKYIVPYNLPNTPASYNVSVQIKNSLHESAVVSEPVVLLSDLASDISPLKDKLRIAQSYGATAAPNAYADGLKCLYSWVSLYNNSNAPINLSTVAIWTRYGNATSTYDDVALAWNTVPDGTTSEWTKTVLSGTIQPGKYFLIQGAKVANIVAEETLTPCITFDVFVPDLVLPSLFVSSKMTNIYLSDATLQSITGDPFASGACSTGFIDLYGCTNIETGTEVYPTPYSIVNYIIKNSKQQVKTLINPTTGALDNSTDYSSTSIKSLTPVTIQASVAKPRNSTYVAS